MDQNEKTVSRYLRGRGLTAVRFKKIDTRLGKTPDFRVYSDGNFAFFCEVKASPKDNWLDEQQQQTAPNKIFGGLRQDPIFNRLTSDIHTAVKQFDAVNPQRVYPNVLALVNHDDTCGFQDLLAVLTGNFYADDGTSHSIYKQFSHGRIKEGKQRIDLFVWIDHHGPNHLLFSQADKVLHSLVAKAFNSRGIMQIT